MDRDQQIFECCKEMKRLGFINTHKPNDYYYVRPDMLIKFDDLDSLTLKRNDKKYVNLDELIFQPGLEYLIGVLKPNYIEFSMTSGVYVSTTYGNQEFRTNGETAWLALAGNWISIEKVKNVEITPIDLDTLPISKIDI